MNLDCAVVNILVMFCHGQVAVAEASSVEELAAPSDEPGTVAAAYELTAVIWQVCDNVDAAAQAAEDAQDEHMVAHINVRKPVPVGVDHSTQTMKLQLSD